MEIIFERCPSCDTHACAFAVIDGKTHCPMCAPVPDKTPHDYRPTFHELATTPHDYRPTFHELATKYLAPNLISGVCCADSGDCGHECGIS